MPFWFKPEMASTHDDDERQQRLAAIAELEQQHKQRRSGITENEQVDPLSNRKGKYFVLLVSKGSGNLEQRANQDRAETILNEYPHEILDGSNFALTNKRDELFAISTIRGNYPQLFLVDNEVTTFVGDFNIIDRRNDEGTLWALLETRQKPKKKKSIVTSVKSLLKSGTSTRKVKDATVGSHSLSRTAATESLSTKSSSHLDTELPSFTIMEPGEHEASHTASSNKSGNKRHTFESSFGHATTNHFVLDEEEVNLAIKPGSTGQLIYSRSEGDMPLSDDQDPKSKGRRRSRSHGQNKDLRNSASKGHTSAVANEPNEKDESKDEEKTRKSTTKSAKSSPRSKCENENGHQDEEQEGGEVEGTVTKPRKHRSTSRGRLSESIKSSRHGEEHEGRKSSRSRSRGRLRDSVKGSKYGEKATSPTKKSKENGEMDLKGEESPKTSTRSKSLSKRNLRSVDSEGKEGETEEDIGIQPKPRKSRSKGVLMTNDGDDHMSSNDGALKPKSKTRLREQDGEKHPTGRRRGGHSASPHKLREKTIVRSNSPGTYRGGIARKREAMKEFREKRSLKAIDPVDLSPGNGVKPRKHSSVGSINVAGLSSLSAPRRHQSLLGGQNEAKDLDQIDESLHELVRRVKDKEKKERIDVETTEDEVQRPEPGMSSVQW